VTGLTNETIGNYRVVQQLGEGGMGVVCLAQHPIIGRKVAIKLLHPVLSSHPEVVTRFFNEARAIHTIAHENVVEILDFGQTEGGQPYFIMEFLEGEPLSDAVARGPMDPARVGLIADQMCRALSAAHAKGIVHRDLKPQNVQLVTRPNGDLQVKVLDFGVAKILAPLESAQSPKTRTGSLMGTPLYMSPEQCRGAGTVDARADIYSLGVMLFEMLAGRPPFMAEGVGELFTKHMFEPPPPLTDHAPNVPRHLAAAVMKALAKEPNDRLQSMDELRDALSGELELDADEPAVSAGTLPRLSASARSPGQESAPPKRRWRLPAVAASLAIVAAAGLQLMPRTESVGTRHLARPASAPVAEATPAPIVATTAPAPPVALNGPSTPLETARVPSVASIAKTPSSRHHARRVAPVLDEDGLATPSF
jgi:eukaryotic-like serine/threonine-protein kinase